MRKNTKTDKKRIFRKAVMLCAAIIVLALSLTALYIWENNRSFYNKNGVSSDYGAIYIEGERYTPRSDIETVLVIGVDKFVDSISESSYNNDRKADMLLLVVIDEANGNVSAVQIDRDTMADIDVLGVGGKKAGRIRAQIALSHTYGSGGEDSCRNVKRAVSDLLFGINIDHFVSLTMDSVKVMNDAVGGVNLTLTEDFSDFDPTMTKGATLNLNGSQALEYVSRRYGLENSGNAERMKRQAQYMQALYKTFTERAKEDSELPQSLFSSLAGYIVTDVTAPEAERLYEKASALEAGRIYTPAGVSKKGEKYTEFYIDETSLKNEIKNMLFEPDR